MKNFETIADEILTESVAFIPLDEFLRGHRGDVDAAADDLIANAEERVVTKAEANHPGVRDVLLLALGRVSAEAAL